MRRGQSQPQRPGSSRAPGPLTPLSGRPHSRARACGPQRLRTEGVRGPYASPGVSGGRFPPHFKDWGSSRPIAPREGPAPWAMPGRRSGPPGALRLGGEGEAESPQARTPKSILETEAPVRGGRARRPVSHRERRRGSPAAAEESAAARPAEPPAVLPEVLPRTPARGAGPRGATCGAGTRRPHLQRRGCAEPRPLGRAQAAFQGRACVRSERPHRRRARPLALRTGTSRRAGIPCPAGARLHRRRTLRPLRPAASDPAPTAQAQLRFLQNAAFGLSKNAAGEPGLGGAGGGRGRAQVCPAARSAPHTLFPWC